MTQHPDAVPHHTDPAVLELRGVAVALPHGGDRPNAIEDVSFSVAKGEVLCIVGESGSGKSISGQAVFGLLPRRLLLKGGQALLGGTDLMAMPRAQLRRIRGRRIAMIFQEPMTALNPVWTVGNQIEEVFATHTDLSAEARRARALDMMRQVELPDPERMMNAYPHQISCGQRQRIGIARALALEPKIVIAVEPVSALDVSVQAQVLELLADLKDRLVLSMIFVTHDLRVAAQIADRIAVMYQGEIVECGPVADVFGAPGHAYTQRLLAAAPGRHWARRRAEAEGPAGNGGLGIGDAAPLR
jgi:peptide/nickel transport system ATP-binding protein